MSNSRNPIVISCHLSRLPTVDDTPKEIGDDEGGTRNDDEEKKGIDFMVVRRKWAAAPSIGQHPQLDENGQFDIHNITWVDDGLIIAPDPDNGPHQVLAGARVAVAVSEAHDWDGWMRDGQGFGGGEDAPLTYTWTADKGHFAVLDARGKETESDSATGLTATWVAPDHLDTPTTKVDIKCIIDDAPGARVGATDAGTRDDEALERTVNVTVRALDISLNVEAKRSNLLAGGLSEERYQTPITATLREYGQSLAAQTLSFTLESSDSDIPSSISAVNGTWNGDTLNVVTGDNGTASVILTSSRLIDSSAKVKVAYGETEEFSDSVTMSKVEGEMSVEADTIIADGESTIDVYLMLSYEGEAVSGHNTSFRISRVWDEDDNPVQPVDGSFPGYGSISTTQSNTDDIGLAYGTYTSGNLSGTIEFSSADETLLTKASTRLASLRLVQFTPGEVKSPEWFQKGGGGSKGTKAKVTINVIRLTTPSGVAPTNSLSGGQIENALNKIWNTQANIQFKFKNGYSRKLTTAIPGVEPSPGITAAATRGSQIDNAFKGSISAAEQAGINVYLCRGVEEYAEIGAFGWAPTPGYWQFQSDGAGGSAGSLLAHESGHCMSLPHIGGPGVMEDNVMNPHSVTYNGRKVTKQQAQQAYAHVKNDTKYGR